LAEILGYNFPDDMYFEKEHVYAKMLDDGNVVCGMSEFYAKEAGELVYIDLPFEGDEIEAGDVMGKLQSAKYVGKLNAPISGEVMEINPEVEDRAELVNEDPYGEGWILKIKPSNWDEDKAKLMNGEEQLKDWVAAEKKRAEEAQQDSK
jgi:glycine cleavage system H protein